MLKSKRILLGCLIAPFFIACQSEPATETSKVEEDCEVTAVNPNGDSELALLMRQMHEQTAEIKEQIRSGNNEIPENFIKLLEQIEGAEPTDPEVKTPTFSSFNKILGTQARELSQQDSISTGDFNLLIEKCVECHQTFCPGPIKKINKLRFKES